jgi:FlaA1/EpsC-like NDP-sugar epimerase
MSDRGVALTVVARRAAIIAVHLLLWTAALLCAVNLRFDFDVPAQYSDVLSVWLAVLLVLRVAVFYPYGLFRGLWRYTGARDLIAILVATTLSSLAFTGFLAFAFHSFPRSVPLIEWLCAVTLVGGMRFSIRAFRSNELGLARLAPKRERILVLGAGDAGEMLVREIHSRHSMKWEPVGFLDDDSRKRGVSIHGVRVHGPISRLAQKVAQLQVDEVIIAIPSASSAEMRRIVAGCRDAGVRFKTIPGIDHLIDGRVTVSQLRDVAIDDLLGRDPVTLDMCEISDAMSGRVVLVSGAGGSIGSELCRQLCRFQPGALVLLEKTENNLFHIHRELTARFPDLKLVPCIADVTDAPRLQAVFSEHRPDVVFHAAAHKHVPMMEWNPGEAVKNNVLGTKTLADVAHEFKVARFVMISTDKAVNPTSVMGVSKRVAEIYVQALSQRSRTRFVTVRFGNVLGSAGSVIPIFKEQIAAGGPVTVTHPEMTRYFMTIPEASQLVLQAGTMGDGGEIFILDMGEPVKIADLARDLISLSGFEPGVDIDIQFTGMRPGEKLFEELSVAEEDADRTKHPKIFVGRFRPHAWETVQRYIRDLADLSEARPQEIRRKFAEIVPEYRSPSHVAPVPTPLPELSEPVLKLVSR